MSRRGLVNLRDPVTIVSFRPEPEGSGRPGICRDAPPAPTAIFIAMAAMGRNPIDLSLPKVAARPPRARGGVAGRDGGNKAAQSAKS
jgi:hypothetical protein